jgi:ankyrin repeat protein
MDAAAAGALEAIAALVGHGLPVDFESNKGKTALMEASKAGVFASIDMLVGCGANINYETRSGMTALMEACAEGRSHLVTGASLTTG